ncbi:hypothetical protein [Foetidibacter luteolus]|uniref:hypothetical protein n=1 Tax=Foetidibacter luteolus TaxID=2608880 RepID=UPI00129BC673|nr:hypothetical protein [Foetidibacter luteolus]
MPQLIRLGCCPEEIPSAKGSRMEAETPLKALCESCCGGVAADSRNKSTEIFLQLTAPNKSIKKID